MNKASLRDEHRQLTQARIVGAARQLFFEQGYVATRMEEVAREAGLSRTTLYQHFASKTAIMETILDEEVPRFSEILAVMQNGQLDRAKIATLLQRMAQHYQTHSQFVAILREAVATEAAVGRRIDKSYRGVIEVLMHHLPRDRALEMDERTRRIRLYICLSAAASMFERCLDPNWVDDQELLLSELTALWCSMFGL